MTETLAQLDFATLALKGKRYQEAEKIYMELAVNENSAEAWLGIGICKLYQLTESKTIEEVIFCFIKSAAIAPASKAELEEQLMMHTLLVLNTYARLIEAAAKKHQEAKKTAQTAALLTGLSIVAGLNSSSTFGTVASLAGTGAGVGVAVDSLNSMNDYQSLINTVLNKCDEANKGVCQFVDRNRSEFVSFQQNVSSIVSFVENALSVINQSKKSNRPKATGLNKWLIRNTSPLDNLKLIQAFFGVHKFKEGKILIGALYLIFFGGYGILAYIDSVKMANDEYDGYKLLN